MNEIFPNKPKLEKPESYVTNNDRNIVYWSLFIAILCTLPLIDPFSYFTSFFNADLLRAIPLKLGLLFFILPLAIYYGIMTMERCYFNELIKQEGRRVELFKKRQKIHFTARYRVIDDLHTNWELTNRSAFSWSNCKFLVERTHNGEVLTEKKELGTVPQMRRVSLRSELSCPSGAVWRVMVLSEEGHCIDYPERQGSLTYGQ